MTARPAIIIGLGTSGCEVALEVYKAYKEFIQKPENKPTKDAVQFMLIDSDEPVAGSEELQSINRFYQVGHKNGDELYRAMWAADPFFRQWWHPEFTRVGPMFPGCGTISAKGRLAFWSSIGQPGSSQNFETNFEQLMERAANAAPKMAFGWVPVYLICTLCGGTGAGMALDIAYMIRRVQRGGSNAEIHGILMLPSIPVMRAKPENYEHIKANGYGSLIALNYWMTSPASRPVGISPFTERQGLVLNGEDAPFNICWLISQQNRVGRSLQRWSDVKRQISDAISMMVFEETASDFVSQLNNFIIDPKVVGEFENQPRAFGSMSAYALRYQPENTLRYLANHYGQKSVSAFRMTPSDPGTADRLLAEQYIDYMQLREKSPNPSEPVDQVIHQLAAPRKDIALVDPVNVQQFLSKPAISDTRKLNEAIKLLMESQRARTDGQTPARDGVTFKVKVEKNRQDLLDKTLKYSQPTGTTMVSGLYQTVQMLLLNQSDGLARARGFLTELRVALKDQRNSIQYELDDHHELKITGENTAFRELEAKSNLDRVVKVVGQKMFKGFRNRAGAIKTFKDIFWDIWREKYEALIVKREVLVFYDALDRKIEQLQNYLTQYVEHDLSEIEIKMGADGREALGRRIGENEATLEDLVLQDENILQAYFAGKAGEFGNEGRNIVAEYTNTFLSTLAGNQELSQPEVDAIRQTYRDTLRSALVTAGEGRFKRFAEELSLWDALKIEAEFNHEDLVVYIQSRVNIALSKCKPYWNLKDGYLDAMQLKLAPLGLYSFDSQEIHDFEARNNVHLQLETQLGQFAAASNGKSVRSGMISSAYELKIFFAEGGAPLYFHHEPEICLEAFRNWRETETMVPVITDERLEEYLDTVGDYPFRILEKADMEDEENRYYILMAEQLKVIRSPLIESDGNNTSGTYQYREDRLGTIRQQAFLKLMDRKKAATLGEIRGQVEQRLRPLSDDERKDQLVDLYRRLRIAAISSPNEQIRALVKSQYQLIKNRINRDFHMSAAALDYEVAKRERRLFGKIRSTDEVVPIGEIKARPARLSKKATPKVKRISKKKAAIVAAPKGTRSVAQKPKQKRGHK